MLSLSRVLSAVGLCALLGGPLSVAPAFAQSTPVAQNGPAQATTNGSSVSGVATDSNGAPLADVIITLAGGGVNRQTTRTDAKGVYRFASVEPGIYSISARKSGYNPATETDVVVVSGQPLSLTVRLEVATLTSLREIGRTSTSSRSRSQFNATPASVAVINQQVFVDQGQPQVQRVLDQTPGIVIDHPGTSANNAAPGAITFPSIRGGLGFETASLIDGHPLAVGNFGDYVTTFLNSFTLGGVELIKGPGASAPEINYAIGGTVNFRTLDPAPKPSGSLVLGMDSYGGQFSNFLYTGSTLNGKLGWVLDYAINGSPGPLRDVNNLTTLGSGVNINCTPAQFTAGTCKTAGTTTGAVANAATNGFQNNPNYGTASLFACCLRINQNFNNKSELAKLRYNLSGSTTITASYLGSQTWTDQNGNHVYQYPSVFTPAGSAYTGSLTPGTGVAVAQNVFYSDTEWEINNEPIFQAEIRSTIGKDTILFRGYGASINRLQYNTPTSASDPYFTTLALNGTTQTCPATFSYNVALATCTKNGAASVAPTVTTYNGQQVPIEMNGTYFRSAEEDKIRGFTAEFDHFINNGKGDVLSLAVDQTYSNTAAYDYVGSPNVQGVPAGSRQRFQTVLLRGSFNPTPKLNVTVSNYIDQYYQRYSDNGGTTFKEQISNRYDGRLGIAYRANRDVSFRFAMGSAIAPPYLNLLDRTVTAPTAANGNTFATNNIASGKLLPETSFGYNFGFDARLPGDGATTLGFDIYRTNLQNQFLSSEQFGGNVDVCPTGFRLTGTGATPCGPNSPGPAPVGTINLPLYSTGVTNLGTSRYEGMELAIRRQPLIGFGYLAQGALIRAYPYGVSPCFYSTTVVNGVLDCTARNTNLAVINGVNFQNSGTSGSPGSFNSVSNHAIPYSQGYAEESFAWRNGARMSVGQQYYGPNNSLNVPAFVAWNANARLPIGGRNTMFAINVDNLFNVYGNSYITPFGGTQVPLVNGKTGLTNANVLTPRVFRFSLTRTFGN